VTRRGLTALIAALLLTGCYTPQDADPSLPAGNEVCFDAEGLPVTC
jgi:hypothetical protein